MKLYSNSGEYKEQKVVKDEGELELERLSPVHTRMSGGWPVYLVLTQKMQKCLAPSWTSLFLLLPFNPRHFVT